MRWLLLARRAPEPQVTTEGNKVQETRSAGAAMGLGPFRVYGSQRLRQWRAAQNSTWLRRQQTCTSSPSKVSTEASPSSHQVQSAGCVALPTVCRVFVHVFFPGRRSACSSPLGFKASSSRTFLFFGCRGRRLVMCQMLLVTLRLDAWSREQCKSWLAQQRKHSAYSRLP